MIVRCLLPWCPHTSFLVTPRRLLLLLPPLLLLLLLLLRSPSLLCLEEDSGSLAEVCRQASAGLALGDLCRQVCEVPPAIRALGCRPSHAAKALVFPAVFRGDQAVVVKARTLDIHTEAQGSVFYSDEAGVEQFPGIEEFTAMIASHLALNMNLTVEGSLLYKLWPSWTRHREDFSQEQNKLLLESGMKNVWALALDPEYVLSRLFKHYDVFPELYGSCGGLYMVEQLRPLPTTSMFKALSFPAFSDRVRIALAMLDLLEELDTMFTSPLHLCDVKAEHFGISDNGRVKFLDLDSVQLRHLADRTVGDSTDCSRHADCDFFDCRGRCDATTRRCTGGVLNNNLQVVCEKVLLGGEAWGRGLLDSRHASPELRRVLGECAKPGGGEEADRAAAGEKVQARLRAALQEIADMATRLEKDTVQKDV